MKRERREPDFDDTFLDTRRPRRPRSRERRWGSDDLDPIYHYEKPHPASKRRPLSLMEKMFGRRTGPNIPDWDYPLVQPGRPIRSIAQAIFGPLEISRKQHDVYTATEFGLPKYGMTRIYRHGKSVLLPFRKTVVTFLSLWVYAVLTPGADHSHKPFVALPPTSDGYANVRVDNRHVENSIFEAKTPEVAPAPRQTLPGPTELPALEL